MIAITTSNSISVKPRFDALLTRASCDVGSIRRRSNDERIETVGTVLPGWGTRPG